MAVSIVKRGNRTEYGENPRPNVDVKFFKGAYQMVKVDTALTVISMAYSQLYNIAMTIIQLSCYQRNINLNPRVTTILRD